MDEAEKGGGKYKRKMSMPIKRVLLALAMIAWQAKAQTVDYNRGYALSHLASTSVDVSKFTDNTFEVGVRYDQQELELYFTDSFDIAELLLISSDDCTAKGIA